MNFEFLNLPCDFFTYLNNFIILRILRMLNVTQDSKKKANILIWVLYNMKYLKRLTKKKTEIFDSFEFLQKLW